MSKPMGCRGGIPPKGLLTPEEADMELRIYEAKQGVRQSAIHLARQAKYSLDAAMACVVSFLQVAGECEDMRSELFRHSKEAGEALERLRLALERSKFHAGGRTNDHEGGEPIAEEENERCVVTEA
jgi:hypothetical protein